MKGVVIDKKLFSRVIKDRKSKAKDKDLVQELEDQFNRQSTDLKNKLVDKLLMLLNNRTSQGVMNNYKETIIPKKAKFTQKSLLAIDFASINPNKWTTDKEDNEKIKTLIHNYNIKHKEYYGIYNRNLSTVSISNDPYICNRELL